MALLYVSKNNNWSLTAEYAAKDLIGDDAELSKHVHIVFRDRLIHGEDIACER
jgi:hypothetical protein